MNPCRLSDGRTEDVQRRLLRTRQLTLKKFSHFPPVSDNVQVTARKSTHRRPTTVLQNGEQCQDLSTLQNGNHLEPLTAANHPSLGNKPRAKKTLRSQPRMPEIRRRVVEADMELRVCLQKIPPSDNKEKQPLLAANVQNVDKRNQVTVLSVKTNSEEDNNVIGVKDHLEGLSIKDTVNAMRGSLALRLKGKFRNTVDLTRTQSDTYSDTSLTPKEDAGTNDTSQNRILSAENLEVVDHITNGNTSKEAFPSTDGLSKVITEYEFIDDVAEEVKCANFVDDFQLNGDHSKDVASPKPYDDGRNSNDDAESEEGLQLWLDESSSDSVMGVAKQPTHLKSDESPLPVKFKEEIDVPPELSPETSSMETPSSPEMPVLSPVHETASSVSNGGSLNVPNSSSSEQSYEQGMALAFNLKIPQVVLEPLSYTVLRHYSPPVKQKKPLSPAKSPLSDRVTRLTAKLRQASGNVQDVKAEEEEIKPSPEVISIDGIDFMSFETEEALNEFTLHNQKDKTDGFGDLDDSDLAFGEINDSGKFAFKFEKPIIPTKTDDITKIKGWRNKVFAAETTQVVPDAEEVKKVHWTKRKQMFKHLSFSQRKRSGLLNLVKRRRFRFKATNFTRKKMHKKPLACSEAQVAIAPSVNPAAEEQQVHTESVESDKLTDVPKTTASVFQSKILDEFLEKNTELNVKFTQESSMVGHYVPEPVAPTNEAKLTYEMLLKSNRRPSSLITPAVERTFAGKVGTTAEGGPGKVSRKRRGRPPKSAAERCALPLPTNNVVAAENSYGKMVPAVSGNKIDDPSRPRRECRLLRTKYGWFQQFETVYMPIGEPGSPVPTSVISQSPRTSSASMQPSFISEVEANFAVKALILPQKLSANNQKPEKLQAVITSSSSSESSPSPPSSTPPSRASPARVATSPARVATSPARVATSPARVATSLSRTCREEEFCKLGCICDSLKVRKRRRRHCGKVGCMLQCTCGAAFDIQKPEKSVHHASANLIMTDEGPVKRRRETRLPARLMDSAFLWNQGKDFLVDPEVEAVIRNSKKPKLDKPRLLPKELVSEKRDDHYLSYRPSQHMKQNLPGEPKVPPIRISNIRARASYPVITPAAAKPNTDQQQRFKLQENCAKRAPQTSEIVRELVHNRTYIPIGTPNHVHGNVVMNSTGSDARALITVEHNENGSSFLKFMGLFPNTGHKYFIPTLTRSGNFVTDVMKAFMKNIFIEETLNRPKSTSSAVNDNGKQDNDCFIVEEKSSQQALNDFKSTGVHQKPNLNSKPSKPFTSVLGYVIAKSDLKLAAKQATLKQTCASVSVKICLGSYVPFQSNPTSAIPAFGVYAVQGYATHVFVGPFNINVNSSGQVLSEAIDQTSTSPSAQLDLQRIPESTQHIGTKPSLERFKIHNGQVIGIDPSRPLGVAKKRNVFTSITASSRAKVQKGADGLTTVKIAPRTTTKTARSASSRNSGSVARDVALVVSEMVSSVVAREELCNGRTSGSLHSLAHGSSTLSLYKNRSPDSGVNDDDSNEDECIIDNVVTTITENGSPVCKPLSVVLSRKECENYIQAHKRCYRVHQERHRRHQLQKYINHLFGLLHPEATYETHTSFRQILEEARDSIQQLTSHDKGMQELKQTLMHRRKLLFKEYTDLLKGQPINQKKAEEKLTKKLQACCKAKKGKVYRGYKGVLIWTADEEDEQWSLGDTKKSTPGVRFNKRGAASSSESSSSSSSSSSSTSDESDALLSGISIPTNSESSDSERVAILSKQPIGNRKRRRRPVASKARKKPLLENCIVIGSESDSDEEVDICGVDDGFAPRTASFGKFDSSSSSMSFGANNVNTGIPVARSINDEKIYLLNLEHSYASTAWAPGSENEPIRQPAPYPVLTTRSAEVKTEATTEDDADEEEEEEEENESNFNDKIQRQRLDFCAARKPTTHEERYDSSSPLNYLPQMRSSDLISSLAASQERRNLQESYLNCMFLPNGESSVDPSLPLSEKLERIRPLVVNGIVNERSFMRLEQKLAKVRSVLNDTVELPKHDKRLRFDLVNEDPDTKSLQGEELTDGSRVRLDQNILFNTTTAKAKPADLPSSLNALDKSKFLREILTAKPGETGPAQKDNGLEVLAYSTHPQYRKQVFSANRSGPRLECVEELLADEQSDTTPESFEGNFRTTENNCALPRTLGFQNLVVGTKVTSLIPIKQNILTNADKLYAPSVAKMVEKLVPVPVLSRFLPAFCLNSQGFEPMSVICSDVMVETDKRLSPPPAEPSSEALPKIISCKSISEKDFHDFKDS